MAVRRKALARSISIVDLGNGNSPTCKVFLGTSLSLSLSLSTEEILAGKRGNVDERYKLLEESADGRNGDNFGLTDHARARRTDSAKVESATVLDLIARRSIVEIATSSWHCVKREMTFYTILQTAICVSLNLPR